jgi:hypothetical protein
MALDKVSEDFLDLNYLQNSRIDYETFDYSGNNSNCLSIILGDSLYEAMLA